MSETATGTSRQPEFSRSLELMPLEAIDAEDRLFELSPDWMLTPALVESIRQIGVQNPVQLQQRADRGWRIVDGFQRCRAARLCGLPRLPCLVRLEDGDPLPLLLLRAREKLVSPGLTPLEVGLLLAKLRDRFGIERQQLTRDVLPRLGLAPDGRQLKLHLGLAALPEALQRLFRQGNLRLALRLNRWSRDDQHFFARLLETYRPGVNRQKELFELLDDLRGQARQAGRVNGAARMWQVHVTGGNDRKSWPERVESALTDLRAARFPALTRHRKRAQELQKALRLPPEIQLNLPPHFEGDRIELRTTASDPAQLRKVGRTLTTISDRPELAELFELL